ncbi:MAG TPA: DNA replication/repair protein RecF [Gammaproteobacteria bacterium]|jgi:DNA replication and repair protein RecF|nr:DNA replication/repair protein RecF [Gammaproteobacteria bacterium]
MPLSRLTLRDFRCFAALDLDPAPRANLILGDNASGKTSLLEAIFFLSRGRSFRTPKADSLARHGAEGFLLSAQAQDAGGTVALGLARQGGALEARIGGAPAKSLSELTERLPVQLLDSSAHQLIEGGPRHRRQFLDWGVFHVEQSFLPAWRRYQRALKQRNTLLRQKAAENLLKPFEPELATAGAFLDQHRRDYLAQLEPVAVDWAQRLLGPMELSLRYQRGWGEGKTLEEALAAGRVRDREVGTTQTGPHRAEMAITLGGLPAQQQVSRGQQKVLAGALLLAQAAYLRQATGRPCLLLLDDLAAELDAGHLGRFLELVRETEAQVFLTSVEKHRLPAWPDAVLFHVEHGKIVKRV